MKKLQCENCGAALTVNEEEWTATCEYCGTKILLSEPDSGEQKKEVEEQDKEWKTYEKVSVRKKRKGPNFLMLIVLIIFILASSIILTVFVGIQHTYSESSIKEETEYSWPVTGLAALIPEPNFSNGEILSDTTEIFSSVLYKVSQQDFDSYVAECREMGFDIEAEGSNSSFTAYNEEGAYLELYYWLEEQELSVYLNAPENMTELIWPKDGMALKLPKPASDQGSILWGDEENISIVVYLDFKEQFEQYKDSCIEYGYTENYEYSFSDQKYGWYEADNKDGYHLNLDYEDRFYKKMHIHLEKE